MPLLMRLAWRNLFRNTRRTLLTAAVIGFGLASLIFQNSLLNGMFDAMIRRATETFEGHGQVYAAGFRQTREVERVLPDYRRLMQRLEERSDVRAVAPRLQSPAMLNSPKETLAVTLYGIDPSREESVSQIRRGLTEGSMLESDGVRQILLGYEIADLLQVELGDRVVATLSRADSGELSQELFRVQGFFQVGEPLLDKSVAFITLAEAQRLIGLEGSVHSLVIKFSSAREATADTQTLWSDFSRDGILAKHWRDLSPGLEAILSLSGTATAVIIVILFSLVILIIMNSLFMALFERLTEFGVLRALGTRPFSLARLIILESLSLGLVSIVFGSLLGFALVALFSAIGIDYSGIEVGGVTLTERIYPRFTWTQLLFFPPLILLFTLAAAIYPAITAASILPVRAMRQEWN